MLPEEQIPSTLFSPPTAFATQPSFTRIQELPFHELSWEDFERLCLRLAQQRGAPSHCQRYGTVGQKQHGIDIYARMSGTRPYAVWQCKHYKEITASILKNAVTIFLRGKWKKRSRCFVLCTTAVTEKTDFAEEIEIQAARLKEEGVELEILGRTGLSNLLKELPKIVDDFFSRPWVEAFCGEAAASSLGTRIDGASMAELRTQLGSFYRRVFNLHDPGLPGLGWDARPAPNIEERYVVPDVLVESLVDQRTISPDKSGQDSEGERKRSENLSMEPTLLDRRMTIDQWLCSADNLLLIGAPGAGKSTLLRFLALDLLSDDPVLPQMAAKYPSCIPIWVPFAYWTNMFAERPADQCSLSDFVRSWFSSWEADELSALLDSALADGRLVLLIDGIDEWESSQTASLAVQRLSEFTGRHGTPLVCTSRPYGIERAVTVAPQVTQGHLAGLTSGQQQELTQRWFGHWLQDESGKAGAVHANELATALNSGGDLAILASNPLMLTLLARLWLQQKSLPENRFAAYDNIIQHLVAVHPGLRATAASYSGAAGTLNAADAKDILAFAAFQMHERARYFESRDMLRQELVSHLVQTGNTSETARVWTDDILGQAPGASPLLVSESATDVGFLHRSLLEHLAAMWALGFGFKEQCALMHKHAGDKRWREVLLGIVYGSRREEVNHLVNILETAAETEGLSENPRLMLAEIAFGNFRIPLACSTRLTHQAIDYVELGNSSRIRQQLASIVVGGYQTARSKELVSKRIKSWFPSGPKYKSGVYRALGALDRSRELEDTLFQGLNHEDPGAQRSAANAIAQAFTGDDLVAVRLLNVLSTPNRPITQAGALLALDSGWSDHAMLAELSEMAVKSPCDELRMVSHKIQVRLGTHQAVDLDDLLRLLQDRSSLHYGWMDLGPSVIAKGWKGEVKLNDHIRRSLSSPHETQLRNAQGWRLAKLLIPGDGQIAASIQATFTGARTFLTREDWFWDTVADFQDNEDVRKTVESWILKQEWNEPAICRAASIFQTPTIKQFLVSKFEDRGQYLFWSARGLVAGWSVEDEEVASLLETVMCEGARLSSSVAHLMPAVLKEAAFDRLLELLGDPDCLRRDFVMQTLVDLTDEQVLPKVVEAFFAVQLSEESWSAQSARSTLLGMGSKDPRVLAMVESDLEYAGDTLSQLVVGYGNDPAFRSRILELSRSVPGFVRRAAVDALVNQRPTESVSELLEHFSGEVRGDIRCIAADMYCSITKGPDALILKLKSEATSYGTGLDEKRQAAFCGLLALHRIDVLNDTRETIGDSELTAIPLQTEYSMNSALAIRIVRDWDYIQDEWGDDAWKRFGNPGTGYSSELSFWGELAPWIDPNSSMAAHVMSVIAEFEGVLPVAALEFYGRIINDAHFLSYCEKFLTGDDELIPDYGSLARIADMIASRYEGDRTVLAKLLSPLGNAFPSDRILLTVARGWPDCSWLQEVYRRLSGGGARVSGIAVFELTCSSAGGEKVVDLVRRIVEDNSQPSAIYSQHYVSAVVRRARRDSSLLEGLRELTDEANSLSLQFTGASLVAMVEGVTADLRAWAERVTEEYKSASLAPCAYDLSAGSVRDVQTGIWDLLSGGK